MKKIICIIAIFCVILSLFSGCKGRTVVETSDVTASTDEMLYNAPLVFLGKVKVQQEGHYRNPDLSKKAEDGNPIYNAWITPYTVEIIEVYKGDLKKDITELTLSLFNFYSPEYMEENNVEAEPHYLTEGDTLVFCATYIEADESYGPLWGTNGCYEATDKANIFSNGHDTIDISRIEDHLAAVAKRTDLTPMGQFYIPTEDTEK